MLTSKLHAKHTSSSNVHVSDRWTSKRMSARSAMNEPSLTIASCGRNGYYTKKDINLHQYQERSTLASGA